MLTVADAAGWRMREGAHLNGGAEWFGYIFGCVEQPRLSRLDRYERATRSVTSTWRCDGVEAGSLAEAVERLNTPAVLTEAEAAALALIGDEPEDYREAIDFRVLHWLTAKGAVIWGPPGRCRRAPAEASA